MVAGVGHALPQDDGQQFAIAGGEPRPLQIEPHAAAQPPAAGRRAVVLGRPAEGGQGVAQLGRGRSGWLPKVGLRKDAGPATPPTTVRVAPMANVARRDPTIRFWLAR